MLTVYTALTDDRDTLRPPEVVTDGVDYVCMSNHVKSPGVWRVVPIPVLVSDPVRAARWCKIQGYKRVAAETRSDRSIWMDATYCPASDMADLATRHLADCDVATFPHFERNCIYDEARVVMAMGLDDPGLVEAQVESMLAAGYPVGNGLADTSIVVRRHSTAVSDLCDLWWRTLALFSRRDQLSFDYVLWKSGMKCGRLGPGTTRRNSVMDQTFQPYFSARFHEHKQWVRPW